jgi:hypothetical protein
MNDMDDTPEHVEMAGGGTICRHCGGAVDKDGFSTGGLVTADTGDFEPVGDDVEADETEQHEDTERKRALAFSSAVSRRHGKQG